MDIYCQDVALNVCGVIHKCYIATSEGPVQAGAHDEGTKLSCSSDWADAVTFWHLKDQERACVCVIHLGFAF